MIVVLFWLLDLACSPFRLVVHGVRWLFSASYRKRFQRNGVREHFALQNVL